MTKETRIKLQSLLADSAFYSGLCDCMKAAVALAYFEQHGLVLEESEALETWNAAMEASSHSGLLNDQQLDRVAGGASSDKNCEQTDSFGGCVEWGYANSMR